MQRREFIRVVGVGGISALLLPSLVDCNEPGSRVLQAWEKPDATLDLQRQLLSYAILAPNAHNKQPWKVRLFDDGLDLYVDAERLLPQTDPDRRQILISQGTFIETLVIAASRYGLTTSITVFPDGEDAFDTVGSRPVARITWFHDKGKETDVLFDQILSRHTNRRVYEGPPLTNAESDDLQHAVADPGFAVHLVRDTGDIRNLAEIMIDAMRLETGNAGMHGETVSMIRFDERELEQHRDGLGLANLGLTGFQGLMAGLFVKRSTAMDAPFREKTVAVTREAAFSARAIGVLCSPGHDVVNQINSGRHFARLFLTATRLGLSLQPMSQVLEIPSSRDRLVELLNLRNRTPQMIFRLGRSSPTPHAPRRLLSDFMMA